MATHCDAQGFGNPQPICKVQIGLSSINLNFVSGILVGFPYFSPPFRGEFPHLSFTASRGEFTKELSPFRQDFLGETWRLGNPSSGGRNGIDSNQGPFFPTWWTPEILYCTLLHSLSWVFLTCREGWLCTLPRHVATCMYRNSRWWCFSMNCIPQRDSAQFWPRT